MGRSPKSLKELMMTRFTRIVSLAVAATLGFFLLGGLAAAAVKLIKGQTLCVPCYTSASSTQQVVSLKANLMVHNADPNNQINLVRLEYYDANGKMVSKYLQKPIKLNPLAATRLVLAEPVKGDISSGNLIVQWQADKKVIEPVINCVLLGSAGTHGYSVTTQGRVIQEEAD